MKTENVRLLEDRVAVRPDRPETETEGGLAIANPAAKGRGTVVTCGPGRRVPPRNELQRMAVRPGDVVLYGRFTGGEIAIGGETLLLMRECDVTAVVDAADSDRAAAEPGKGGDGAEKKVDAGKKPGKVAYDARCGADCDCTPVDGAEDAPRASDVIPPPPPVPPANKNDCDTGC